MLNRLSIFGFQRHKKLILDLEQITVITGDNEKGKSSIVRALKWVTRNSWNGESTKFINWDMDSCDVRLELDDTIVIRFRNKTDNLYILGSEAYRAFGTKVPDPIKKVLNMTPDNFQEQLDLPFWLTLNNSQAATALNEIFDLTIIDSTVSNVAREVREAKTRVTISKERLEQATKTKKELDWTIQANKDLKTIESLFTEIETVKEEQVKTELLLCKIKEFGDLEQELLTEIEHKERLMEVGSEWISTKEEIGFTVEDIEIIKSTRLEIKQLESTIESKTKTLNKWFSGKCPLCNRG